MLQVLSKLKGYAIKATDGPIGTANDFLFDDSSMKVRWLVVDTGNWMTGRKVLIHPSAVGYADHLQRELTVELTKSQVRECRDIGQDLPVSMQMRNDPYGVDEWRSAADGSLYSAGIYGGGLCGVDMRVMEPPVPARTYFGANQPDNNEPSPTTEQEADPHLRSISEVTGYHVHASDGSIGYVENFLIDSESWVVRYLIVNTSVWWFGQHVLISPHAVKDIDWTDRYIQIEIARDQVKASPPWNSADPVDKEFEDRLYDHYDWPTDERQSSLEALERP